MGSTNHKKTPNGVLTGIGLGVLVGNILMLFGVLAITFLTFRESVELDDLGYGALIINILSASIGTLVAIRGMKDKVFIKSCGTALGIFLFEAAIGLLFYENGLDGVLVTLIVLLGSALATTLLFGRDKYRNRGGYSKR